MEQESGGLCMTIPAGTPRQGEEGAIPSLSVRKPPAPDAGLPQPPHRAGGGSFFEVFFDGLA